MRETDRAERPASAAGVLRPWLRLLPGLRRWYVASAVLGVLAAAATLGLLALSGWFISAAAVAGQLPATALVFNYFLPGAGVRALALTRTAGRWGERVITHEATFRMLARVRVRLLARLLPLAPRQIGAFHGVDLLHRFMRDVEQLDGLLPRLVLPAVVLAVVLGGGGGVLAGSSPLAGGLALGLLAVFCVLPAGVWRIGRGRAEAWVERRADLRRAMADAADGVGVLAFERGAWAAYRARALRCADAAMAAQARNDRLAAVLRAGVIATVGVVAWGGLLGGAAEMDGPRLVAIVLLMLGVAEIAAPLAGSLVEWPAIMLAAARIEAVAGQQPAVRYPSVGLRPGDGGLRVENVDFSWDAGTPVLAGFSLAVADGEHVFISGPSGCGKSSLVQLLARFELPGAGCIRLGGVALDAIDEPTLRATLAVATQFPWVRAASLADNLRLADQGADADELWAVLEVVGLADTVAGWPEGLETWVEEGGRSLSGGQLRRLGVARALLRRAPLTVLDEPTEGLDDAAAEALATRVRAWSRGRTLLWISHRPHGQEGFGRVVGFGAG